MEAFIERRHGQFLTQEEAACPKCERLLRARPSRSRTVETLLGPVTLERPYFYCVGCHHGFYPLDEALGLSGQRKQWDVQQAGVKLGLEMPHQRAAKLLDELTDASMSDCVIHEVLQQTGALDVLQVCPDAADIQDRIAQAAAGRKWRPIVVLAIDAADVPRRPETAKGTRPGRQKSRARRRRWQGEYHEAKGFRFYLIDDERIEQLISWHQMGNEQAFGAALRQVKEAGLIPEDQVRLCAIGDGAGWIWKWVEELFPSARQILDYYHCSSYLHAVAEAQYGADAARASPLAGSDSGAPVLRRRQRRGLGSAAHAAGLGRGRRGHRHGLDLPAKATAPGRFRQPSQGRIPDRVGGDRIGASLHRPRSSETIRRLVV